MLGNVKSSLAGRSVAALSSQVPTYLRCCSLIIDIRFWRSLLEKGKLQTSRSALQTCSTQQRVLCLTQSESALPVLFRNLKAD